MGRGSASAVEAGPNSKFLDGSFIRSGPLAQGREEGGSGWRGGGLLVAGGKEHGSATL